MNLISFVRNQIAWGPSTIISKRLKKVTLWFTFKNHDPHSFVKKILRDNNVNLGLFSFYIQNYRKRFTTLLARKSCMMEKNLHPNIWPLLKSSFRTLNLSFLLVFTNHKFNHPNITLPTNQAIKFFNGCNEKHWGMKNSRKYNNHNTLEPTGSPASRFIPGKALRLQTIQTGNSNNHWCTSGRRSRAFLRSKLYSNIQWILQEQGKAHGRVWQMVGVETSFNH